MLIIANDQVKLLEATIVNTVYRVQQMSGLTKAQRVGMSNRGSGPKTNRTVNTLEIMLSKNVIMFCEEGN